MEYRGIGEPRYRRSACSWKDIGISISQYSFLPINIYSVVRDETKEVCTRKAFMKHTHAPEKCSSTTIFLCQSIEWRFII